MNCTYCVCLEEHEMGQFPPKDEDNQNGKIILPHFTAF